ncbi:MAG: methionyl-tRNA formyltransferase [Cytophagales bacterium]|nr:methionyl-tRNA formyltransferase [Cytophagales bacterium]
MVEALRIVFLGTPEFAVASLRNLVENNCNVVAVISAPDRPKGRGKQVSTSAVKDYAVSVELPVLQPTNLKSQEFIEELKGYRADLQIVVAFRMLPQLVWNMPRLGTFNLHASLLPQYRGAAPINWAIINGEKETGVTTFFLKHEIDTGKIIFQETEEIREEDNVGSLYERLMIRGGKLVVKTVKAITEGSYPQIEQDTSIELKSAPKIFRETCSIDWNQPTLKVRNFIRGLSPYPAAFTVLKDQNLKIFKGEGAVGSSKKEIGDFETDGKNYLRFITADGAFDVLELQMQGKKRMTIQDFLRGNQL